MNTALYPLSLAAAFDRGVIEKALTVPELRYDTPNWSQMERPLTHPAQPEAHLTFGEDPFWATELAETTKRCLATAPTPLDAVSGAGMLGQAVAASFVLLKNQRRVLPLTSQLLHEVAVVGASIGQETQSLVACLQQLVPPQLSISFADDSKDTDNDHQAALTVADRSDVVVLCLRTETPDATQFPAAQLSLLQALLALNKPIVAVLCGLCVHALDDIFENCDAVLQAWYPTPYHGMALARVLLGHLNPSGRLPLSYYYNFKDMPDFVPSVDGLPPDLTYLYYKTAPLFPFGYGLSYSKFKYSQLLLSNNKLIPGEGLTATCTIENTGVVSGHEVAQVYLRYESPTPMHFPRWRLCQTTRVFLQPGEYHMLSFTLPGLTFKTQDAEGNAVLQGGRFVLYIGGHQPDVRSVWLTETPVLSSIIQIAGETIPLS